MPDDKPQTTVGDLLDACEETGMFDQSAHADWRPGFFTIGFHPEAGETAEAIIDALKTYCVAITGADGVTADYIIIGWNQWEGHHGMPVRVRRSSENGAPIGDEFTIDAKHIHIY